MKPDELKNWLHRKDLTQADKLLLVLATFDNPVKIKDIKTRAREGGLKITDNWNPSTSLSRSDGLAISTAQGWELSEGGKCHLRALGVRHTTHSPAATAFDLRTELGKIKNDTTRAFAEEATHAYEAGLYRSAIVMSWVTAIDVLYQTVLDQHLNTFNIEAKRVDADWKSAKDRDGLALMKEREFLIRASAIGLIGKNVKAALIECLDRRNGCGHPNSLKLKDRAVAHHVETLVLNVFQVFGAPALSPPLRHPLQARSRTSTTVSRTIAAPPLPQPPHKAAHFATRESTRFGVRRITKPK